MSAASGSVFDRLYDVNSYTGVYAERFRSGPGINASTGEARASMHGVSSFRGYPNEGTDEVIRDISHITRPHFNKSSPAARRTRTGRRGEPSAVESSELPVFPLDANAQLQLVFQYYCKFGRTGGKGESEDSIDNVNFSKFARECPGLLDGFLDRTEIDLIFTKCKSKGARRLSYSQFLDALSAMAAAKYRDEDPATAFSMLLAHHVFHAPPALGVQAAMAKRQQAAQTTRHMGGAPYASRPGSTHSKAGPRAFVRDGHGHSMGGKETDRGDGRAHPHAGPHAGAGAGGDGGFSYGRSPAIDHGHGHGRGGAAYGPGPAQSMGGSMASYGGAGGDPTPGAFDGSAALDSVRGAGATLGHSPTLHDPPVPASARRRAQTRKELLFSPGRSARRDMARAERAQAAEHRTHSQGTTRGGAGARRPMGYGHGVPPPPLPQGALGGGKVVTPGVTRHMDPRVAAFEADASTTGHAGAYGSPAASRRPVAAGAGGHGGGGAGGPSLPTAGVSAVPTAAAVPMGAPRGLRMTSGVDPTMGGHYGGPPQGLGYGQTPGGAPVGTGYYDDIDVDYSKGATSTGGAGGSAVGMRGVPGYRHDHHPLAGPLVADVHGAPQPVHMTKEGLYPAIRRGQSFRDAPLPMRYDPSAQIAQARRRGQEGRAAMARSARGRSHAKFGSPYYTPTLAGEANKPRSVWDRLSQPSSFTGVYKRAYFTDGRMNAFADTGVSAIPTEFTGDTNTQSNETVHDISVLLRPNLKNGKTFR